VRHPDRAIDVPAPEPLLVDDFLAFAFEPAGVGTVQFLARVGGGAVGSGQGNRLVAVGIGLHDQDVAPHQQAALFEGGFAGAGRGVGGGVARRRARRDHGRLKAVGAGGERRRLERSGANGEGEQSFHERISW
jgi:hypothetical protein